MTVMARLLRTHPKREPNRLYSKIEHRTRYRRARGSHKGRVKEHWQRVQQFYLDTDRDTFYRVPGRDKPTRRLDVRGLMLGESKFIRANFALQDNYSVTFNGHKLAWDMRTFPPESLRERQRTWASEVKPQRNLIISDEERERLADRFPDYEPWAMWQRKTAKGPVTYIFLRRDAKHWFWVLAGETRGTP